MYVLYGHDQLYKHIIHIHLHMHAEHNDDTIMRRDTVLRKIYLSLYWKGCVWKGVGDRTELQHNDPHSIGHNRVSFPSFWATQPGAQPLRDMFLNPASSPNWSDLQTDWISCALSYIIVQPPASSFGRHKLHSFNPSTVKVILCYSSTGCTCYLHRCISNFDSPAGS